MTYVTLQEQILEQLKELEQFVQRYESELEQPSPEKSQRLSCSPDVNRLDIANIAISLTWNTSKPRCLTTMGPTRSCLYHRNRRHRCWGRPEWRRHRPVSIRRACPSGTSPSAFVTIHKDPLKICRCGNLSLEF